MPRLFRRREILLPTLLGWVLLAALLVAAALVAVHRIHGFLAINQPVPGAELLVVEGWMSEQELDRAVAAFDRGGYVLLVTTGGPIERWSGLIGFSDFAAFSADYLTRQGVPPDQVVAVPAPASAQDRTFLSAVKLREWLQDAGRRYDAIDVLSSGTHARRSRRLFQQALGPDMNVGVLSVEPSGYDPDAWWRSSPGVKTVLGEIISMAWTACCFHPPAPGSHDELWGAPRPAVD
jgi:uncharacterized SAM-binding protein YcdF (DUF218 family)